MNNFCFEDIKKSAKQIPPQGHQSYLISYREFIDYFTNLEKIEFHNFIIATHFVYGWMPKILQLRSFPEENSFMDICPSLLTTLNKIKRRLEISDKELNLLVTVINNSIVGVSKLLHFINPEDYAIWDSNVYKYIYEERPHNYRVKDIKKYKCYLQTCSEISMDAAFPDLHNEINKKIGYEVSAFRAIEWVMYMDA